MKKVKSLTKRKIEETNNIIEDSSIRKVINDMSIISMLILLVLRFFNIIDTGYFKIILLTNLTGFIVNSIIFFYIYKKVGEICD